MKPAKSILYGATALTVAIGSATAGDPADTLSESMSMDDSMTTASQMYEVDEDRDGRTDRLLMLEQSDSLA
jgi:5-hydroxyisourate hydrolase-like protein (transthyretin family)